MRALTHGGRPASQMIATSTLRVYIMVRGWFEAVAEDQTYATKATRDYEVVGSYEDCTNWISEVKLRSHR